MEFCTSPATAIEALIHINNQLRQPEAAVGVLTYAQVRRGAFLDLDRGCRVTLGHGRLCDTGHPTPRLTHITCIPSA